MSSRKRAPLLVGSIFAVALLGVIGYAVKDSVNLTALNIGMTAAILFQGCFVVSRMWQMERRVTSFPLTAAFFGMQHLAFGFGGLLVSVFDQSYVYVNAQGTFASADTVLPLALTHIVSLNIAAVAVSLVTRTQPDITRNRHWEDWSWRKMALPCYISLAIHAPVWFLLVHFNFGVLSYLGSAISAFTNATFVLWGLAWLNSPKKRLFGFYAACYCGLELLSGNRANFIYPIVLFGFGILISSRDRWHSKYLVHQLRWLPLVAILFWGVIESEDLRGIFGRTLPSSLADFSARVSEVEGGTSDAREYLDGSRMVVNGPFRIGNRLFETSAADVISRTPSSIPFSGWNDEDTSVLLASFLPARLFPDSIVSTSAAAGVLFLHDYGWSEVDPTKGNSMPATVLADCWRRFGWPGVCSIYFFWPLFLCWAGVRLRFSTRSVGFMTFALGIAACMSFAYTADIVTLFASLPRRVIISAIYAFLVWAPTKFFAAAQARPTGDRKLALVDSGDQSWAPAVYAAPAHSGQQR